MQSELSLPTKQAILHTQTKFKLNKLYRHSEKGSKDGKQVFGGNSTTDAMHGYSLKTEKAYLYWIKYFIRFHKLRHPRDMGSNKVTDFLSYLANEQHVAINTQKVALNAIAYLYNQFLQKPLGDLGFTCAKKPQAY